MAGRRTATFQFSRRPAAYHRGGHEPRQAGYGPYRRGEANADGAASAFPTFVLMPALMPGKWQAPPQEKINVIMNGGSYEGLR